MEARPEPASGEVKHLQRCINDLVSLLALPAIWSGGDPSQILHTLLDALMRMLNLDLVSVRLTAPVGEPPVEIVRIAEARGPMPPPHEIFEALSLSLEDNSRSWPPCLRSLMGEGDVSIVPLPLGLQGEFGVILAAAQRADFPQQTEALLLSVAASQAAIGLKEAHLLHYERELAKELDRRVVQRTSELTTANEELHEARSALQKALDEVQKSEAKLRQVIDAIPTLAWCNLPDGPNEFLNKGWHDYTGLSPEESHGWGWQAAFHPEDLPPLMEQWGRMLVSGEPDEIEARLRRHDGAYRWFLIRAQAFRDESGKILRWYGTSTDIEDRKRGEEALRDREQSLRLILDGIAGLVAIMGATGEVEAVNRQVLDYFGDSIEQVKGWSTSDAVHPEDLPGVISAWRHSVETVSPYDVDHRLRRADGVYRWFHARGLPLRDREGRVLRWYVLLTDIDDRRRAEEQLATARAELARVNRVTSLAVLTASIAHEVNQPLSGIITNASTCLRMLAADPPNVDGARETARRTIRDGNRASEVITRLRALYGKKDPTIELVDLNEAAREVLALSLSELQRNRVLVQLELADGLPLVAGNRVQLQQVILNLLRNASDAMSAVDDRPRQLLIRTERDEDDQVRLMVKDAGVGFAPQAADQLFDSFYTTKTDGMGIGLSVSRSIIESHHGRLWATQNNGPGATFSFSVPSVSEGATGADSNRDIRTPDATDAA